MFVVINPFLDSPRPQTDEQALLVLGVWMGERHFKIIIRNKSLIQFCRNCYKLRGKMYCVYMEIFCDKTHFTKKMGFPSILGRIPAFFKNSINFKSTDHLSRY